MAFIQNALFIEREPIMNSHGYLVVRAKELTYVLNNLPKLIIKKN
jgi:uncharacterized circularly permuted ATP-grasp superfamily protein